MYLTLYINNDYSTGFAMEISYQIIKMQCSLLWVPTMHFFMEPTEYILVSHEHSLVNLGLSEPTGLFTGKEHFHRHLFSSPATEPHFSIPPFSDLTYHLNLFSDGALDLWIERIGQFNSKYLMVHNYKHLYWLKKFPWPFPYLFKTVLIYITVNPVFFLKNMFRNSASPAGGALNQSQCLTD